MDNIEQHNGVTLLTLLLVVIPWLMGVVLAQGFTQIACAVLFPPYAWYLTVERVMQLTGLI